MILYSKQQVNVAIVLLSLPHELMIGNPRVWKNSGVLWCMGALPVAAILQLPRPISALAYGQQQCNNNYYAEKHFKDNKTTFVIYYTQSLD